MLPQRSHTTLAFERVESSYNEHLCINGGNIFVGIVAPIKHVQGRRLETFRYKLPPYLVWEWLEVQQFCFPYEIRILLALSKVVDIVFQRLIMAA